MLLVGHAPGGRQPSWEFPEAQMSKIKDEAEMQVSKLREDLLKEGGQLLPPRPRRSLRYCIDAPASGLLTGCWWAS